MDRRDFSRVLLGAAGALALPARATGAAPWALGFAALQADAEPLAMSVQGRLPAGLRGSFYRNGPAGHAPGGVRYHHWFDGDGLMQRYDLGPGGVEHRARFVRTPKFVAESAAGRPLRRAFGTNPPNAEPVGAADAMNAANTSVLPLGGELLALWEGGSAMRLDARTLETRGFKDWSAETTGLPFSAHPRVERDGSVWNFGIAAMQGLLVLWRIGADGRLAQAATLPVPQLPMVHDFAVTERHLVFLLPPFVFERERFEAGATFLGSHDWRPGLGLRALVLPKDRLDAPRWFELPAAFVFHLGNAWDDGATLRLDCMRSPDVWHATTGLEQAMAGRYTPHEHARLMQVALDLGTGTARQQLLPHTAEFPRIDPAVTGRRHRQLFMAARIAPGDRPGHDAVTRLDLDSGRADTYRYGADVIVEEHVFVARPGATREGDGWLVGTALDLKRRQSRLAVFDARRVADGPLLQATMARAMPLGLHGAFMAA